MITEIDGGLAGDGVQLHVNETMNERIRNIPIPMRHFVTSRQALHQLARDRLEIDPAVRQLRGTGAFFQHRHHVWNTRLLSRFAGNFTYPLTSGEALQVLLRLLFAMLVAQHPCCRTHRFPVSLVRRSVPE